MDSRAIQKKLSDYIIRDSGADLSVIDPHVNLMESGLIDSIGVYSMLSFIEKEFGFFLEIEEIGMEPLMTLNGIVSQIEIRSKSHPKLG